MPESLYAYGRTVEAIFIFLIANFSAQPGLYYSQVDKHPLIYIGISELAGCKIDTANSGLHMGSRGLQLSAAARRVDYQPMFSIRV